MEQEQVSIKTPEYVSLQFSIAGLGSRSAAFIIDQLFLFLLNGLIFLGLFFLLESDLDQDLILLFNGYETFIAVIIVIIFVLNTGYYLFLEYFWGGRTIGKKIIGLRVIQDNGHSITLLSSFIRNFLRIIDSLPAAYFVGMLLVFLHPKHKRLGDLAAGTIVVHENITKRKKKRKKSIEKIISARGLSKENLVLESWQQKALDQKDWHLIKTFCERYEGLPMHEKYQLTNQVATIIFPKIDRTVDNKDTVYIENTLFVLYLYMKDEWEFEL
ncbi:MULTISPECIES: RDD family protein [Paraliobacillus]|uniref:RDD family protein n=1 Tax=Paraliobacillus TaxID=200903 RepID=UPI000DD36DDD|nr:MULTISPECIES: RDD family protein [Paraliobacillus]